MVFDIVTIFPRMIEAGLAEGVVGRARERGLIDVTVRNLRDFTADRHHVVDDVPFGGGPGMVMKPEPFFTAMAAVEAERGRPEAVVMLSPAGRRFTQADAARFAALGQVVLLCGRYEGVDERVREHLATDAVSVGPYVLAGGELAAMVVADAVLRKLPGALGHSDSALEESFSEALAGEPEYPHYTRPASYRGWEVPDVLLSGDHARVRAWRLEQSRARGEGG
jgi:tRNA (guanine37-N1)-methyltransferase